MMRQYRIVDGAWPARRRFNRDEEMSGGKTHAFVRVGAHAGAWIAGRATAVAQTGEREIRSGVIEQITETQMASNHHRGLGAVVGGVAGLGIGSLIGAARGATWPWSWARWAAR
jgi:hypothetical protein